MRIVAPPSVRVAVAVSGVLALISVFSAREACAQSSDLVGVRASGMGGAFTAVADDATASWWNPAGLAGGAYFNALIETSTHHDPPIDPELAGPRPSGWLADARSIAVAFPALGLSYYRLKISDIQPQGPPADDAPVRLRALSIRQFGSTIAQSLGSNLVIGSTVKLVRAGAVAQLRPAAAASLDAAADLDVPEETHADLDVGVMASIHSLRLGLTVRNVRETEFGSGDNAFKLQRTVRAGAALSSGTRGVIGSATVAFDADLTTSPSVLGDERRLAVGAEAWTTGRSLGLRGGFGTNTIGSRRTSLSFGGSAAVKRGIYVDGEVTGGTDLGRKGWGVATRVTF